MIKTIIFTEHAPAPIGPYSQAVLIGETLYISGQIAINPEDNNMVTGGIAEETEQVMKNIGVILKAADLNYHHVVKSSIFIKNMGDFPVVNEVYGKYFEKTPPARETVEVSQLPKDANVEISCIAVKS